jgi:hypothetical protein
MFRGDSMHWTHVIKDAAILLGVICIAVAYNLAPYLTPKFYWVPKTLTGQVVWLLVWVGFPIAYYTISSGF